MSSRPERLFDSSLLHNTNIYYMQCSLNGEVMQVYATSALGLLVVLSILLRVMLLLLADPASICLFPVEVGKDEAKDLVIPAGRMALNALFDVLYLHVSRNTRIGTLASGSVPREAPASRTCYPVGRRSFCSPRVVRPLSSLGVHRFEGLCPSGSAPPS